MAERLGHSPETALKLCKAVAGLNAQSNARRLGLVKDKISETEPTPPAARSRRPQTVEVLGRAVTVTKTKDGLRATAKEEPIKLYEQFRPSVLVDEKGWGAAGTLDLTRIKRMANQAKR